VAGRLAPTHLGGLGFGFKWNMGWMHDSLDYVAREPVYRGYHHHQMTFSMVYAYSENYVLPISHDEVVHGKGSLLRKMPGDRWQQLANVRAYLAFMWAHPGKQLLFMGQEFAQESEWSEERSLDWWLLDTPDHRGVALLVKELNEVYKATPSLYTQDHDAAGFAWIDANDASGNVFSFLRYGDDGSALACIANFAGQPHDGYRLGPALGRHVARGAEHRRRGLRRQRRRQPRQRRGQQRRGLARPAGVGPAAPAAAGHRVAGQRGSGRVGAAGVCDALDRVAECADVRPRQRSRGRGRSRLPRGSRLQLRRAGRPGRPDPRRRGGRTRLPAGERHRCA
jgi:hypothetical protein